MEKKKRKKETTTTDEIHTTRRAVAAFLVSQDETVLFKELLFHSFDQTAPLATCRNRTRTAAYLAPLISIVQKRSIISRHASNLD